MRRFVVAVAMLALVGGALVASPGLAQTGYDVSVSPAVDTPERTVEFEGDTYTVADIGRVDPGETISVTVSAPNDHLYDVLLYNADRQIENSTGATDERSVSFPTAYRAGGNYEPGSYVVAVSHDGSFQAVQPVVVSGYRASVDAPSSTEPGEEITVEASVTTVDDAKPIEQVQVVIGNDDEKQQESLSAVGGGEYTGTITLDSLSEGEYSLYVVVQGAADVFGKKELLGASDSHPFTVGSDDSSGDGSDESSSSDTRTAATTESTSTTEQTTGPKETDGSTPTGSTVGETTSPPTTTDGSVITPNPTTSAASTTTSPGQPLGVLPAVAALILAAALARRR